jgi:hypothetical protein
MGGKVPFDIIGLGLDYFEASNEKEGGQPVEPH